MTKKLPVLTVVLLVLSQLFTACPVAVDPDYIPGGGGPPIEVPPGFEGGTWRGSAVAYRDGILWVYITFDDAGEITYVEVIPGEFESMYIDAIAAAVLHARTMMILNNNIDVDIIPTITYTTTAIKEAAQAAYDAMRAQWPL